MGTQLLISFLSKVLRIYFASSIRSDFSGPVRTIPMTSGSLMNFMSRWTTPLLILVLGLVRAEFFPDKFRYSRRKYPVKSAWWSRVPLGHKIRSSVSQEKRCSFPLSWLLTNFPGGCALRAHSESDSCVWGSLTWLMSWTRAGLSPRFSVA